MRKTWLKVGLGALGIAAMAFAAPGCGKKAKKVSIRVNARGLGSLNAASVAGLLAQSGNLSGMSVDSPQYNTGEHDGLGVVSSDAKVDSLKVVVTSVALNTGVPGQSGGKVSTVTINQELDISLGVNQEVGVTGSIEAGTYVSAAVGFKPGFKIKAYAYFDRNNDGDVDDAGDATVYTTANQIKLVSGKVNMATATDYAEYTYGFLYPYCSNSLTASTDGNCGSITPFTQPITVSEGSSPTITLVISALREVLAWTGENTSNGGYGTGLNRFSHRTKIGDGVTKLGPISFPLESTCSDTPNPWGLNTCNFFPGGSPAFAVGYLPAFAFLDTSGLESQVYLVSTESGKFGHYHAKALTIVVKNGVPQVGMISGKIIGGWDFVMGGTAHGYIGGTNPILGSVARLFEKEGATNKYTFHMDYGDDNNGVQDGGLYYNNDKSMAGYIAEGFEPLASVNDTGSFTVRDGPRCKDEYNYCFASAVNPSLLETNLIPGYDSATGKRTYYYKRIK